MHMAQPISISTFWPVASSYVSDRAMADPTERLPLELLAEILRHVSGLDVVRFKQVKSQSLMCGQIS